jgi:tetratricopeptide (TPR) repeat protein
MHKNQKNAAILQLEIPQKLTENDRGGTFAGAARLWSDTFHISLLSLSGRFAEAEDSLRVFRARISDENQLELGLYFWTKGVVDLANEAPDSAVLHLEKSLGKVRHRRPWHRVLVEYYLAEAYLESGRPSSAEEVIESVLQYRYTYDVSHSILTVKAHYLAGVIHETLGDNEMAAIHYEEFLELWKDADSDIEEVSEAKRRLSRLRQSG